LRARLEQTKDLVGVHGVYTMSPDNHNGMDERARVLVQATGGSWHLLP
jgi:branched-chain amino acid transport system substrate-binding protein